MKAALVALAVFTSGAAGVAVGANVVGGTGGSDTVAEAPNMDSTAVPTSGPVSGSTAEPVAAVASVLAPAVVQIETDTGLGSGFVYDGEGLIMTAAHVVEGARSVTVRFADGTRVTGTVVGTDSSTDVGVVQVEGVENLKVASLALGVDLQVGQTAVAIGSPFGLHQTVTAGIVSAIGRSTETQGQDGVIRAIPAIQTDAPINSGNSGGALADRQGRVIGINSSIITADQSSSGNVGVGFAVPIDIAKAVADRLVAGTSPVSGYLGVSSSDSAGSSAGAEIQEVETGSPADGAGVAVGDIVVGFDGRSIGSAIDLVAAVTTHAPGDEVELTLVRDGERVAVTVVLDRSPY
ncbi:MAG: trypsin-like peptidase domain-containing protein [Microthrixaceae bacterium]|jgi:putative serine protease PepD|nr:trypsin-like peptidase domain-containing protein [Microthrixaceae bacterium]